MSSIAVRKMSRRTAAILAAILAALALPLVATGAQACRCTEPPTPQAAYRNADGVVIAEVLAVDGNHTAVGGALATLRVSKAWKARVPARLTVETRTTCAFNFHTAETYLVYLTSAHGRAPYATRICRGNLLARDAAGAIEWLDRHGKSIPLEP
jgi:hypothetical protein